MRASETTYYDIRRLHVVFALSALALLAVTVWMVAADHWRSWKVYQRTFRDRVEPWLTEAWLRERKTEEFAFREQEIEGALAEARQAVPERESIERFCAAVEQIASRREGPPPDLTPIQNARESLADEPSAEARQKLLDRLGEHVAAAADRRDGLDRRLRFRRAEFDEARSAFEAAAGEGLSEERLRRLQARVTQAKRDVDVLARRAERAAADHQTLRGLLAEITKAEDEARRALAEHRAAVARLRRTLAEQRPSAAKRVLDMPIVDALGRPLAIEQIWLPELTLDYNFRRVARFDRCPTCHQGIDKTLPGSPFQPACLNEERLALELAIPGFQGAEEADAPDRGARTLQSLYGLTLAPRGVLDDHQPTVGRVLPRTAAADAGLLPGDAVLAVDGRKPADRSAAERALLEAGAGPAVSAEGGRREAVDAETGDDSDEGPRAVRLDVRRGLPHPYRSHPRLDLFVGSLSPHPMSEFGCTACHRGQGSATEFKFASHTPNTPEEGNRWRREHDWFWNEHWDLPMLAERFAESSCLACHHDVTDLAPSQRFPDPPAPKLLAGYDLVRTRGCFGCHEIRGIGPSGERVGPDMRLEPNYAAAARRLIHSAELAGDQRSLARRVADRPEDPAPRQRLVASLAGDEGLGAAVRRLAEPAARGDAVARALDVLATDLDAPGTMRKVGPSLRDVAGKLDADFIDAWLRKPSAIRPDTQMPQIYDLQPFLTGETRDKVKRYEAAEVYAVTEYLLGVSQPVEALEPPPEVTEPPSAERGKRLFLTQGCAACHKHDDFPEAQSTHGPNLSALAGKLTTEVGRRWMVSWIRDPSRYSSRTLMPNTLLEPVPLAAEDDGPGDSAAPRMTDPAADVAAYLLESDDPVEPPAARPKLAASDLDELVMLHLAGAISTQSARDYLRGDLELTADRAQGDAVELLGRVSLDKKLRYVGRRTIRKRGCFGCHDVPGFEDAKPIGPALSDWGRKQESLLAFEQIGRFLADARRWRSPKTGPEGSGRAKKAPGRGDAPRKSEPIPFYIEALLAHRREGFVWQKLRGPRSFDYMKAQNKPYNEHLTMGRFTLTPEEREAIVTFVLGLVADPPAEKYVHQPDRRARAIAEGRKVLDRYACAECHVLEMERWQIRYAPEEVEEPYEVEDFAFVARRTEAERPGETAADRRGLYAAEAVGMPQRDEWGEILEDVDDDDHPMYYLNLWEPLALKTADQWEVWRVGSAQLAVSDPFGVVGREAGAGALGPLTVEEQRIRPTYAPQLRRIRPAWGGAFSRMLFPHVLDDDNPAVMEAWGWVPPPLVGEGAKVEPAWLHDYLLEPFAIRPASVLRMPKYTLSAEEAAKLVDYFAAAAGVPFPYTAPPRSRDTALDPDEPERPGRLDDAMRIVIDRVTFCAKCHLVGDYTPGGEIATVLGPRLDRVGERLRPDYLRRWLANPKSVLPYTGMPVNFPPTGPPLGQDLFEGESLEQLDAVADLLLGYDAYLQRRTSIRRMIEAAEHAKPPADTEPAAP